MKPAARIFVVAVAMAVLVAGVASAAIERGEFPRPSIPIQLPTPVTVDGAPSVDRVSGALPDLAGAPPLSSTIEGFNFDDNSTNTGGFLVIPPDPFGAAGIDHVVNVGNVSIQVFTKAGVKLSEQSLKSFFAPVGPPLGTFTFDPKVIFDQHASRFVVIALERSDVGSGAAADDSYILVAVSKTADPTMGWWFATIHSKMNIGGVMRWADYPGLGVDASAVYVTANMFAFSSGGGGFGGERVWIIDKNPLYSGGAIVATAYDAFGAAGVAGFASTAQPAHVFGTIPGNVGTYLVSYSGLTNGGVGGAEFLNVIEIADPLGGGGGPFFTQQFVNVGDIENIGGGFGFPTLTDAPQAGTNRRIEVRDRALLSAVWRNGELFATATITPNAGADAGQTTAHWFKLNTMGGIGAIALADGGDAGAEDLGAGTYTFYPSVAVDNCGDMALGFAASSASMFPSACYTGRLVTDPAGTVQSTGILAAGMDYYYRAFGGTRNRWGDYSSIAIDPVDDATFWVYNEYALMRGTVIPSQPTEDGRWGTRWGAFNLGCSPVPVAITSFDAFTERGGVRLSARFEPNPRGFDVELYRIDGSSDLARRIDVVHNGGTDALDYLDASVRPGATYTYYVVTRDGDGALTSPRVTVTLPGMRTALHPNTPNPFNPTTTIAFDLASRTRVTLRVYDVAGRVVRTLVDGVRDAGAHRAVWDGRDDRGARVASGIYLLRLQAGAVSQTRKMVLMK